jgi:hypothetical protein
VPFIEASAQKSPALPTRQSPPLARRPFIKGG